jgi:hypothetical protein
VAGLRFPKISRNVMPSPSTVEEFKHILDPSTLEDEGITYI